MSDDRRCLVVDGHPVARLGVRELLGARFAVEEAADLRGAQEMLTGIGDFDVAIVELDGAGDQSSDGTAIIRALHKAQPGLGIVAHGRRAERHAASNAIDAGASCFVAKSSPPGSLEEAVDAALRSSRYVDPAASRSRRSVLTKRQREILQLLADGNSTAAVALRLGLSAETVRTHAKAILARLKARDRAHAVAIALRSGLID